MAHIPEKVRKQALVRSMLNQLISQGKVGDKYNFPLEAGKLMSVRSDRLSVFDFVLLLLAQYKGQVLTALTDFWAHEILEPMGIKHHLVKSKRYPGRNLARDAGDFFSDLDLSRTLVIQGAEVLEFELIFRHHPGGSVWKQYLKDGTIAGIKLPEGLKKWQKLDTPIFTPSTKATKGHDVNITVDEFYAATGKEGRKIVDMLMEVYMAVYGYCEQRQILILDTKCEGNKDGDMILDEWFTPDSSRFVKKAEFLEAFTAGKEPGFMDKQPVRDYCATITTPFKDSEGKQIIGINNLKPDNLEHLEFVSNLELPQRVADETSQRYLEIFQLITGMPLSEYQEKFLL